MDSTSIPLFSLPPTPVKYCPLSFCDPLILLGFLLASVSFAGSTSFPQPLNAAMSQGLGHLFCLHSHSRWVQLILWPWIPAIILKYTSSILSLLSIWLVDIFISQMSKQDLMLSSTPNTPPHSPPISMIWVPSLRYLSLWESSLTFLFLSQTASKSSSLNLTTSLPLQYYTLIQIIINSCLDYSNSLLLLSCPYQLPTYIQSTLQQVEWSFEKCKSNHIAPLLQTLQ